MTAKKKSAPEKRTLVAIVLDSSGSMSSMKEEAIDLFNTQLDEVRKGAKDAGETRLSLVVFGEHPTSPERAGDVRAVHENKAPGEIERLTEKTYRPQAMTPMRDGIGRAISVLEAEDDEGDDTACLVIVVTDGLENASREWSAEALSKKVVDLQETGRWTFAIYGCDDLDLAELRETAGLGAVPMANVGSYVRGAAGMAAGSAQMSTHTSSYMSARGGGMTASTSFAEDKDEEES